MCLDIVRNLKRLEKASPFLFKAIKESPDLKVAKKRIGIYISKHEFRMADPTGSNLDNIIGREAISIMRNIIAPGNEKALGFSAIRLLRELTRGRSDRAPRDLSEGFFEEFRHLFLAIERKTRVYEGKKVPEFLRMQGRKAAVERSKDLDQMAIKVMDYIKRYKTGLEEEVVQRRNGNRKRILDALGGTEDDWTDWRWHLKNVAKTSDALGNLVTLSKEERDAIDTAQQNRIPFGVTPYYAHLMDDDTDRTYDHAVRAQVIPPNDYVDILARRKKDRKEALDFMREGDTSPIDLITRRYPSICILKPYNACPQVCVYCQRNWEIQEVMAPDAMATPNRLEAALRWLEEHPAIREILVTGGDPLVIKNDRLRTILERLAGMSHVERIRIGTRMPVTVPFRIDEGFIEIINNLHRPPEREICIVTHAEHVYEITPDVMTAVQAIRRCAISMFNQMVFTVENSRRFEAAALRRLLRLVGITPYYTFCTKGKEETRRYRVPIARLLQETKEEARLQSGMDRTDMVVYNLPRLGKNYLTKAQHHDVISILPNGRRVYEFHPWEKKIRPTETFINTDVSIHEYLQDLKARGENLADYDTIWYYY